MQNWFDTPINVIPQRSLNTYRDVNNVVRCRNIRECSDDEVLKALRSQGVNEVKHIMTKRDDKTVPSNAFILTRSLLHRHRLWIVWMSEPYIYTAFFTGNSTLIRIRSKNSPLLQMPEVQTRKK